MRFFHPHGWFYLSATNPRPPCHTMYSRGIECWYLDRARITFLTRLGLNLDKPEPIVPRQFGVLKWAQEGTSSYRRLYTLVICLCPLLVSKVHKIFKFMNKITKKCRVAEVLSSYMGKITLPHASPYIAPNVLKRWVMGASSLVDHKPSPHELKH